MLHCKAKMTIILRQFFFLHDNYNGMEGVLYKKCANYKVLGYCNANYAKESLNKDRGLHIFGISNKL